MNDGKTSNIRLNEISVEELIKYKLNRNRETGSQAAIKPFCQLKLNKN